ncbi:MAG: CRISPR-associated endonuclease Cas2 [Cyanobacteria bacterium QS_5_48_63]|nr:MAG: CRISPR-associated endonuclease Cas2 [Cyanobacteria bacterium QS_5_48_63]
MVYLICYDVVDDYRRNKISQVLEGYGLRVQWSVFECELTKKQCQTLQSKLTRYLNEGEDQVRFYPVSAHNWRNALILGVQPQFQVGDTTFIV